MIKHYKIVLFLIVTLITFLLSGCGSSPKLEGKWIGSSETINSKEPYIYTVEIKKTGDDYFLENTVYKYKKTGDFRSDIKKTQYKHRIKTRISIGYNVSDEYTYVTKNKIVAECVKNKWSNNVPYKLKDNKLVDSSGRGLYYDKEKDILKEMTPNGNECTRFKTEDFDKLEKKLQEKFIQNNSVGKARLEFHGEYGTQYYVIDSEVEFRNSNHITSIYKPEKVDEIHSFSMPGVCDDRNKFDNFFNFRKVFFKEGPHDIPVKNPEFKMEYYDKKIAFLDKVTLTSHTVNNKVGKITILSEIPFDIKNMEWILPKGSKLEKHTVFLHGDVSDSRKTVSFAEFAGYSNKNYSECDYIDPLKQKMIKEYWKETTPEFFVTQMLVKPIASKEKYYQIDVTYTRQNIMIGDELIQFMFLHMPQYKKICRNPFLEYKIKSVNNFDKVFNKEKTK